MENGEAVLKKILVFGNTGVGKSNLLNYLLGKLAFKSGKSGLPITKKIQCAVGDPNSDVKDFVFIDFPGLKDPDGKDGIRMQELLAKLKSEEIKGINAILFLFKFNDFRGTNDFKTGIKYLSKMFTTPDLWKHVAFIFTSAFYHFSDEDYEDTKNALKMNEGNQKGLYSRLLDFIKEAVEELKKEEPQKFNRTVIPNEIDCYFLDSDIRVKGKRENKRTDDQINTMLNWVRTLNFIDAKSINKDFNPDYRKKEPADPKIVPVGDYYYYYRQWKYTDYSGNIHLITEKEHYYIKPPAVRTVIVEKEKEKKEEEKKEEEKKEPEKPKEDKRNALGKIVDGVGGFVKTVLDTGCDVVAAPVKLFVKGPGEVFKTVGEVFALPIQAIDNAIECVKDPEAKLTDVYGRPLFGEQNNN